MEVFKRAKLKCAEWVFTTELLLDTPLIIDYSNGKREGQSWR